MDNFTSDFSSAGGPGKVDTGTIMEQVKVQIAVANAQELLQRMTDKCFRKCIGKPGGTLDNSEQGKEPSMIISTTQEVWLAAVTRRYPFHERKEAISSFVTSF